MNIALRLKLFRVAAGLRQREIADTLAVSMNFVSMIERGKRDPTLKYLQQFASATQVPLSVLLWDPSDDPGREREAQELHTRVAALMAEYAGSLGVNT